MKTNRAPISVCTLSNGLKTIHIHYPAAAAGYCGLTVKTGSRDDGHATLGLAHFVEHTIFKGTKHRSASRITNRMEAVGGELSAYTTKEETVIYSVFPAGNLARAAELIADIATDSVFPTSEIDKEREVIADEIDSYLDMPSEAVADDFEDLIFAGSDLGHNILGTAESIKGIRSCTCREFLLRNYLAGNMVAFYCGAQPASSVMSTFERYFSVISPGTPSHSELTPRIIPPFSEIRHITSHQAHCVVGAVTPGLTDERRTVYAMLADMLGGPGMNSLLNVELRERRGLVYTVEASTSLFSDCGLLTVYFGCDPDDADKCMDITRRTITGLADKTLPDHKLDKVKKQFFGQLIVAADNKENSVLSAARAMLWRNHIMTDDETLQQINAITPDDIRLAASDLVNASSLAFMPYARR